MELSEKTVFRAEDLQVITSDQAWHYQVMPAGRDGDKLRLYSVSADPALADELEILFGHRIALSPVDPELLRK